tara:strand:+ start:263 stop:1081 length:819 start_codon:yes stop_codon:yes gene_type:complete
MVYRGCDIGSAKPSKDILKKYPHHMIDVVTLDTIFTVADFYSSSHKLIKKIHLKNKVPVFVGGTMMYFKSLYDGIHDLPKRNEEYRNELDKIKNNNKSNYLYKLLHDVDPMYAKSINKNDDIRIIRGLEVYKLTGKCLSKILSEETKNDLSSKYEVFQFGVSNERDKLHKNIEIRLKEIFEMGLVEEVKNLSIKHNISKSHPIHRSVNYKQVFSYINGEYEKEVAFERALFATRQLAKRQTTWLRSWKDFKRIKINDIKEIDNDFKKIISLL